MNHAVRLLDVDFEYRSDTPILTQARAHLSPGWTGLVGANGAGKTTLFRLLLGEIQPTSGHIQRTPRDGVVTWCPQRVSACTDAIHDFANRWDTDAIRLRDTLHLDTGDLWRWETLSPGERKRWQLGTALSHEPDLLLLDEPTNHLDRQGRRWLLEALRTFSGIGVIVSHDRALLDAITTSILWLSHATLTEYRGTYSQARAARADAHQNAHNQKRELAKRVSNAERQRQSAEQRRAGAERQRSGRARITSPRDSDARSIAVKSRIDKATASHARTEGVARRQRDRASQAHAALHVPKELGRTLKAHTDPCPRRVLGALEDATLSVGERPLLRGVTVTLERDSRVGVTGANGAGKTTLVRALLRNLPRERVLYLPQVITPEDMEEMGTELRSRAPESLGHAMNVVAALGTSPDRILSGDAWSPGEARKVALAMGLTRRVWALVLDEPTNHLDLPSVERLEALLTHAYDGALLLISHDETLLQNTTHTRWHVADGEVMESTTHALADQALWVDDSHS